MLDILGGMGMNMPSGEFLEYVSVKVVHNRIHRLSVRFAKLPEALRKNEKCPQGFAK